MTLLLALLLTVTGGSAPALTAPPTDPVPWPETVATSVAPELWGDLPPGPWAVGFAAHYRYDLSRTFEAAGGTRGPSAARQARPIRILTWYPALPPAGAEPMKFRGALEVEPADARFAAWNRWLAGYDLHTTRSTVLALTGDPDRYQGVLLDAPTAAFPGAPPAEGRFPLVLFSLGLNDVSQENTVLFEFLASHGYVVATVPQLGPGPLVSTLGLDPGSLELQTRDLEFARGALAEIPPADTDRVAAAGYSFGGLVALYLAMRDPTVGAVVSLDGTTTHPRGRMILQSPSMNARVRAPMLLMHSVPAEAGERGTSPSVATDDKAAEPGDGPDLDLLDSLALADRWRLELPGAAHGDFTNLPAIAARIYPQSRPAPGLRSNATAARMHQAFCIYTLALLDTALRGSAPALAFLSREPAANGFGTDVISNRVFEPGLSVLTSEELVGIILRQGRKDAAAALDRVLEQYPDAEPGEPALNLWGYTLLAARKTAEAIEVFRFNLDRHPDSANAHDSLAEAYRESGDGRRAIELYEAALRKAASDPALSEEQRQVLERSATENLNRLRREGGK